MKKLISLLLITLCLVFVSCGSENKTEEKPNRPPAFSILEKGTVLKKHTQKGKETAFSKEDFENCLGESISCITVNTLPESEKGTLVYKGQSVVKGQTLPSDSLEYLKFVPNSNCETASFSFTSDGKGYYGSEMVCDIVFGDSINSPPVIENTTLETVCGIACAGKLSITEPNGDDFTLNILSYPKGNIVFSEDGSFVYTPDSDFSGKDSLVYTVTDEFGAVSERGSVSISVLENEKNIHFVDMQDDLNHIYAHKMCENDTMVYRIENGEYYFDPETAVTKLDFLVMLMSVTKQDADIVAVADSVVDDDNGLSSGLKGYLSAATEKGIIKLENGKFSPKEKITLSEAAYMISSALNLPTSESEKTPLATVVKSGIIDMSANGTDGAKTLTKSDVAELLCACEKYITNNNIFREKD